MIASMSRGATVVAGKEAGGGFKRGRRREEGGCGRVMSKGVGCGGQAQERVDGRRWRDVRAYTGYADTPLSMPLWHVHAAWLA